MSPTLTAGTFNHGGACPCHHPPGQVHAAFQCSARPSSTFTLPTALLPATNKSNLSQDKTRRRRCLVRASSSSSSPDSSSSPSPADVAPLAPESPAGKFLVEMLRSHPHLFEQAADQQLEVLAGVDGQGGAEGVVDVSSSSKGDKAEDKTDMVLYRRIQEVRQAERRKALEEVIYALIVQRFIETGAPLLPKVPFITTEITSPTQIPYIGVPKDGELESVHSSDALAMVRDHLAAILGRPEGQASVSDDRILVGTSKFKIGQLYAASIMYGYFLKRIDQRYQLEKSMRALLFGSVVAPPPPSLENNPLLAKEFMLGDGEEKKSDESVEGEEKREGEGEEGGTLSWPQKGGEGATQGRGMSINGVPFILSSGEGGKKGKENNLRTYISSLDGKSLQQNATIRSEESLKVVERQTEALFGKPEAMPHPEGGLGLVVREQQGYISVSTLRRLILEAVTFGSFLWDVENYVDSTVKISVRG